MSQPRIAGLIHACQLPSDADAIANPFTQEEWALLDGFLVPLPLAESAIIYAKGQDERSLLFVESGQVLIHYENSQGQLRLAKIGAGSIFGEASFLSRSARRATAQVAHPGKAWSLGRLKYTELGQRYPQLAMAVTQYAAHILANRAADKKRRAAIS